MFTSPARSGFIVPPKIAEDPEALAVFEEAMGQALAAYDRLVELGTEKRAGEGDRPGGRPFRASQRRRDPHRRHHERPGAAAFLPDPLLPPGAVGDQRAGLAHAGAGHGRRRRMLFRKCGPDCLYGKCHEGKMYCGQVYTLEEVAEMEEWMESIEW